MNTDPIADLLTRVRNAIKAKNKAVEVPASKEKKAIVEVMKDNGFISEYEVLPDLGTQGLLKITLKYTSGNSAIVALQRISRPGLRKYSKCDDLPEVLNGLGISIVSTPKGIMSNKEAKKMRLGGEILCSIY